jgi:hypothetical protein
MGKRPGSQMTTFRITFDGSDRVERVRAESYRSVPPWVELVVADGEGLTLEQRVLAKFDRREISRISTTG